MSKILLENGRVVETLTDITKTNHERKLDYTKERRDHVAKQTLTRFTDEKSELYTPGPSTTKPVNSSGFFAQDNVKKMQSEMLAHLFPIGEMEKNKGRGAIFTDQDSMAQYCTDYFKLSMENEVVPTISGLCAYLLISKRTLLEYANNSNSPYYDVAKAAVDYCHYCLESGATESKLNSVAYIFQGKNYFGMKDSQEITVTAQTNQAVNSQDTLSALREQKAKEEAAKALSMKEAIIVEEKTKKK